MTSPSSDVPNSDVSAAAALPLPTLLSFALVAWTIEFDNEFEHRMPHRTAADRGRPGASGPWLTSHVMWSNVMQYVPPEGIEVGRLHTLARTTHDSLAGLQRWGYVVVSNGSTVRTAAQPILDSAVVTPTANGRLAQATWRPLTAEIDRRWSERFGRSAAELRGALATIVADLDGSFPAFLPIVHPTIDDGGRAEAVKAADTLPRADAPPGDRRRAGDAGTRPISTLLAQVLLAFTLDFESASALALPICVTPIRVLDADGIRVRDLPLLTGVSKECLAMCVGFLERRGCVVVVPAPAGGRARLVRLTPDGVAAQADYLRVLQATEVSWRRRFGAQTVDRLRSVLETVAGDGTPGGLRSSTGCGRTRTAGEPRLDSSPRCRTTRWSCTAAVIRTAAEATLASGATADRTGSNRPRRVRWSVGSPPSRAQPFRRAWWT